MINLKVFSNLIVAVAFILITCPEEGKGYKMLDNNQPVLYYGNPRQSSNTGKWMENLIKRDEMWESGNPRKPFEPTHVKHEDGFTTFDPAKYDADLNQDVMNQRDVEESWVEKTVAPFSNGKKDGGDILRRKPTIIIFSSRN